MFLLQVLYSCFCSCSAAPCLIIRTAVPADDAVWRQVLQHCLRCSRPEVVQLAQQAAAALQGGAAPHTGGNQAQDATAAS